jgi:hypothetical protein
MCNTRVRNLRQPHATEIKIGEAEINARRAHYIANARTNLSLLCSSLTSHSANFVWKKSINKLIQRKTDEKM